MKYKLLALDLDDTLLNDEVKISDKNKDAILAAEALGIHVIFCSGRPKEAMVSYVNEIGVHDQHDYIISYNGAVINRLNNEQVFFKGIEGEILNDLIKIGRNHNIDIQLYQDHLIVERYSEKTKRYEGLTGLPAEVVEDLTTVGRSIKVLFNHVAGAALEELRLELVSKFEDQLNIFYSKPNYIEVLNKEASKGLAVQKLAEELGVLRSEVIAIGDGFNDVSMIEYAGLGVAVANAPDGVKCHADYVTIATNNESAVWEVFDKFIKDKQ